MTPDEIEGMPKRVKIWSQCSQCSGVKDIIVSYEDYATIHGLRVTAGVLLDSLPDDVKTYTFMDE